MKNKINQEFNCWVNCRWDTVEKMISKLKGRLVENIHITRQRKNYQKHKKSVRAV